MLNSIFKILLICFCVVSTAQNKPAAKDSIKITQRYGLRVGIDAYRISRSFYDKNYKGLEFVADYRLTKKFYLAGELGNEQKTVNDDQLNYTAKGTYFKVGFDFNAYENWLDMENLIYIGMRAGVGSFSQTLNHYTIYQAGSNFGQNTVISGEKWNGLSANWIEVVTGLKAKVFSNVFVGFSARLNYMVANKTPDGFANLYIPGFNKTYEGSKFGAGFTYSISYFIPIYKKNKMVAKQD